MDPRMTLESFDFINHSLLMVLKKIGTKDTLLNYALDTFTNQNRGFDLQGVVEHSKVFINNNGEEFKYTIFRPRTPRNIAVFFVNGGGFKTLNIACYRVTLILYAMVTNCIWIGIDYNKAPVTKLPTIINECNTLVNYIIGHEFNTSFKYGICGDSAGGNLAVNLALRSNKFSFQILIYPWLDLTCTSEYITEFGSFKYLLDRIQLKKWANDVLATGDSLDGPIYSPINLQQSALKLFPQTCIVCGELDPLLGDSLTFKSKLESANVAVKFTRFDGCVHGFFSAFRNYSFAHYQCLFLIKKFIDEIIL